MIEFYGVPVSRSTGFVLGEDIAWFGALDIPADTEEPDPTNQNFLYRIVNHPWSNITMKYLDASGKPQFMYLMDGAESVTFIRKTGAAKDDKKNKFNIHGVSRTTVVYISGPELTIPATLPPFWARMKVNGPVHAGGVKELTDKKGYAVLHYDLGIDNVTKEYLAYAMMHNPGGAIRMIMDASNKVTVVTKPIGSANTVPKNAITFNSPINISLDSKNAECVVRVVDSTAITAKVGNTQPCVKLVGYYDEVSNEFVVTGVVYTPYAETNG